MHDIGDPYCPQRPLEELELSLHRLHMEMERRIYAERHPQFVATPVTSVGASQVDEADNDRATSEPLRQAAVQTTVRSVPPGTQ